MSPGIALLLALAIPAVGALLVAGLGRWPNVRDTATLVTSVVLFCVVLAIWGDVRSGVRGSFEIVQLLPGSGSLALALAVEPLGMLFAIIASALWIATSFYAIGYMRAHHESEQTRFFTFFAVAIAAVMGIAFARNLFTLFVFYEALTFSTYPLVTHTRTAEARRSGRIYMGILVGTSVAFFLLAVVWTWFVAGTLEFRAGGILRDHRDALSGGGLILLLALFMFGTGKAALMPFHRWLPAAMVAPTPVSALLHAVAVVKAGVFTVMKIVVYIFGVDYLAETGASQWLLWVAATTILLASLVAMTKDNLKARLAYSTISQLAYVVLGAALANRLGIFGGGMQIAMHAFGKITLFFCAGAIYVAAHKTEISTMNGLGRRMPFTMAAFFIGALSIIGLPPCGGAWSKWYLALGALDHDQLALVAVLMISSLLNVAYLLPIPLRAFFAAPSPDDHAVHGHGDADPAHGADARAAGIHEAPWFCVVPLCITATACLVLFFVPGPLAGLLQLLVDGLG